MENDLSFVVDGMLGRLGKYLRALGYDTLYDSALGESIFAHGSSEGRVIVTARTAVPSSAGGPVVRIDHDSIERQLAALFEQLGVRASRERVLTVCLECNLPTGEVPVEQVAGEVPASVRESQSTCRVCPGCGKVYWWGSHADRIMERLEESGVFG